ncbi:mavicyanin-like [Nicotiana tabacum]|uniref:Mavicyanin-like n=2 Tax=Nicotiana TaxID=4085 RepID=A0A1S4CUJ5_TOBAC|nr:PREDICTED: mavicyanin-like [Nicotiana sylvestris]XP_016504783.1 PREDICTED: mavicyanin-like [Nicotiana tabacum]
MANVYQVGDSKGWTFNYNYDTWTFFKNFQLGDTRVFNYDPRLHNVKQVNIDDYNTCSNKTLIASFNSGSDSVILATPGDYYFLCDIPGHCASGLKLHVIIAAPATPLVTPIAPTKGYPDHFPSNPTNKPPETLQPYHPSANTAYYSSKWFPMSMLFSLILALCF